MRSTTPGPTIMYSLSLLDDRVIAERWTVAVATTARVAQPSTPG
jgi:hypothetical protein